MLLSAVVLVSLACQYDMSSTAAYASPDIDNAATYLGPGVTIHWYVIRFFWVGLSAQSHTHGSRGRFERCRRRSQGSDAHQTSHFLRISAIFRRSNHSSLNRVATLAGASRIEGKTPTIIDAINVSASQAQSKSCTPTFCGCSPAVRRNRLAFMARFYCSRSRSPSIRELLRRVVNIHTPSRYVQDSGRYRRSA